MVGFVPSKGDPRELLSPCKDSERKWPTVNQEAALTRCRICRYLDLGLPAPRAVRNKCSSHLICGNCSSSLRYSPSDKLQEKGKSKVSSRVLASSATSSCGLSPGKHSPMTECGSSLRKPVTLVRGIIYSLYKKGTSFTKGDSPPSPLQGAPWHSELPCPALDVGEPGGVVRKVQTGCTSYYPALGVNLIPHK